MEHAQCSNINSLCTFAFQSPEHDSHFIPLYIGVESGKNQVKKRPFGQGGPSLMAVYNADITASAMRR